MPWHMSLILCAKSEEEWAIVLKICSSQLLASNIHNNFNLRDKITKKNYNLLSFYLSIISTTLYFSKYNTKFLKWYVGGASTRNESYYNIIMDRVNQLLITYEPVGIENNRLSLRNNYCSGAWELTGWRSRLHENYQSFLVEFREYTSSEWRKTERYQ